MSKPVSILMSDIHYNLPNLKLADAALRQAIKKANELNIPLWIAGDLHDTKANIRGECLNALTKTLMLAHRKPLILVGNHDKINEKSEEHSLSVLDGVYAQIINGISHTNNGIYFISYHSDPDTLRGALRTIPPRSTLIMHQGITGSNMGGYVIDKSAITPQDVAGHRVISGHYHARQTIELPNGGKWDYIGNPYTTSYSEADDLEKGFRILMDDGTLEFMPTNLRKHVVIDNTIEKFDGGTYDFNPGDIVWVKLHGSKEALSKINRQCIADKLWTKESFRLDLIPDDTIATIHNNLATLTNSDLLDSLIDSLSNTSVERKGRLKDLWKSLV